MSLFGISMQINHQHLCFSHMFCLPCLFRDGATICFKRANIVAGKKWELVISVTMSDSTPLIPWQHKEFYSVEPMTNQDPDVHCFPTAGGGRSRTELIQIKNGSQALYKRLNMIARVDSIHIGNQSLLQFSVWKCEVYWCYEKVVLQKAVNMYIISVNAADFH